MKTHAAILTGLLVFQSGFAGALAGQVMFDRMLRPRKDW
jgi:hypothetical protein